MKTRQDRHLLNIPDAGENENASGPKKKCRQGRHKSKIVDAGANDYQGIAHDQPQIAGDYCTEVWQMQNVFGADANKGLAVAGVKHVRSIVDAGKDQNVPRPTHVEHR
jgi:hypothetical protein